MNRRSGWHGGAKHYDERKVRRALELREKGLQLPQMAAKMKCSIATISRMLNQASRAGVAVPPPARKSTKLRWNQTPEGKKKFKQMMIERWADPEWRKKNLAALKKAAAKRRSPRT